MRLYVVRVEIREAATGYRYPIVIHEFQGKNPDEAWGYHDAHVQSDAFLRGCEQKQFFAGNVRCRADYNEGWR
jgi:hypothetical protein